MWKTLDQTIPRVHLNHFPQSFSRHFVHFILLLGYRRQHHLRNVGRATAIVDVTDSFHCNQDEEGVGRNGDQMVRAGCVMDVVGSVSAAGALDGKRLVLGLKGSRLNFDAIDWKKFDLLPVERHLMAKVKMDDITIAST
ncbi:hypothetical protein MKZ38_006588 [Zalerion maritima]|uniref:Uncharacterized protein n=1 Tax=Zalerion maritima TaxID=339359 RepID=A0AAD5RJG6_9PEZI|nr:hypothetical protein MKZ38_006588 [Zalerion maritima]